MIKLRKTIQSQNQNQPSWTSPVTVTKAKVAFINKAPPPRVEGDPKEVKISPRTQMKLDQEKYKQDLGSIVKDCNLQNIITQRTLSHFQTGMDMLKIKDGWFDKVQ